MARPCGKPAILASVLLHGAIVAALVLSIDNTAPAPQGSGVAGIAVSLSPGAGAAGSDAAPVFEAVNEPAAAAATAASPVESIEETTVIDPESIPAEAPDSSEPTAAKPVETVDAPSNAVVEPEPIEAEALASIAPTAEKPLETHDAPLPPLATTETAEAIEPEAAKPTVSTDEAPSPTPPIDVADVPPQVVTATAPTKPAKKSKDPAAAPAAAEAIASTTADSGQDRAPAAATAGGASSAATAGVAALDNSASEGAADYMALLQAWLEKHKQYPRRAQLRRLQGTALLYFAMDDDGRVLSFRITRSSGHDLLDTEVAAMIRRAAPLPPVPADMRGARLEFVVPVQFVLR